MVNMLFDAFIAFLNKAYLKQMGYRGSAYYLQVYFWSF